jgi:hypothetical protein
MPTLVPLLEKVAQEVGPQVRAQLSGFLGGFVKAYLPQAWVFRTEHEVATLVVDRTGATSVAEGAAANPDVTIETTLDRLATALSTRARSNLAPGGFSVTTHTPKGKTAFDYLRGRVGL